MRKFAGFSRARKAGAALLLVAAAALHSGASDAVAGEVTVAVKNAVVRKSPSFIAPAAFQTAYGDRFQEIGGENGWIQVKSGKGTGWLHQTAVTEKKVDLSGLTPGEASKGSSAEVVFAAKGIGDRPGASNGIPLPGKGFDATAEKVLASKGRSAGYASLDKLAASSGKGDDLASFAKQGGLLQ